MPSTQYTIETYHTMVGLKNENLYTTEPWYINIEYKRLLYYG